MYGAKVLKFVQYTTIYIKTFKETVLEPFLFKLSADFDEINNYLNWYGWLVGIYMMNCHSNFKHTKSNFYKIAQIIKQICGLA